MTTYHVPQRETKGKEFLFTKGIDIAQGLIILCIGYFICRHIRKVVEKLLNKSDIDHSANSFIVEIIYFFCLAIVIIMALSTMGVSAATLAAAFGGIGLAIALGPVSYTHIRAHETS